MLDDKENETFVNMENFTKSITNEGELKTSEFDTSQNTNIVGKELIHKDSKRKADQISSTCILILKYFNPLNKLFLT